MTPIQTATYRNLKTPLRLVFINGWRCNTETIAPIVRNTTLKGARTA